MMTLVGLLISTLSIRAAVAAAPPTVETRTVAVLDSTMNGQPIVMPRGPTRVTVTEMTLQPGARLPPHRHPFPRQVHVLAGRLHVTDLDTGAARLLVEGEWAVDIVGAWHEGVVMGATPVRLLIIETAPPGVAGTVLSPAGQ